MSFLLKALALSIAAAGIPSQSASPQIPAQPAPLADIIKTGLDEHERMTVPVNIGVHGPFAFMIDTGSQNTVLSTALAGRLGLVSQSRRTVLGAAGSRIVDTVELNDIQFGQQNYNGLLTPLLNREDMDADGIIGLDGLQGQRVLLDFHQKRMALVDSREKGGSSGFEIIVTARRRSGQLILTNAKIDGVYTDVVIDTGSDTSIGNRALQRALSHQHQPINTLLHSVTGQEIAASVVMADSMDIDRIHISNVAIAYADAPTFAALKLEKRPAILLGMRELRLFKRVAIDFTSRKVMFDMPFNMSNLPENMRSMREGYKGQGASPTSNY